jgi:hypothetical protein
VRDIKVDTESGVRVSVTSVNDFKLVNVDDSSYFIKYDFVLGDGPVLNGYSETFYSDGILEFEGLMNLSHDDETGEPIFPIGSFTDTLTIVSEIVDDANINSDGIIFEDENDYFDFYIEDGYVKVNLNSNGLGIWNQTQGEYPHTNYVEFGGYGIDSNWDGESFISFPYYGPGYYYIYYREESDDGNIVVDLSTNVYVSGTSENVEDIISFFVRGVPYRAEKDMNWGMWRASKYNPYSDEELFYAPDNSVVLYDSLIIYLDGNPVYYDDVIIPNEFYN